ncbi:hypothetical protein P8C59_008524 [Phyllachora maydis]|uniref:GCS light chain n=1 Tax=Phyllachora maydis TaxID=1825666 RepID=A0AAD9ICF9_9PEZI|nr:hypothetical protein P8C59_008524 [Phyllachora maydis]
MVKIILSTGNIVSGGPSIIRKPGAYRSNLELTNSLRSNFLAARQDFADEDARSGGDDGSGIGHDKGPNCHLRTPAWTAQEGDTLYVPRIDRSSGGLQEDESRYEITVKLFFLPTSAVADRARYARESLAMVCRELRVQQVDLLVGNDDEEAATWAALESLHVEGLVRNLGIAEFGSDKLARFLRLIRIRPTVDQINIKNCCNVPPPLMKLAKEEGIELLVHSDCTDVLPQGTLRELLGQGPRGAGVLADPDNETGGLQGDLTPQWVMKYTAVVRDRGVIEDKGYFASAELVPA